jgi:hypothetical protein
MHSNDIGRRRQNALQYFFNYFDKGKASNIKAVGGPLSSAAKLTVQDTTHFVPTITFKPIMLQVGWVTQPSKPSSYSSRVRSTP